MNYSNPVVHSDPVCRMPVGENASHHFTHRGIAYRFCSAQCLERFEENPDLYAGLHHAANAPALLKQRSVRLQATQEATDAFLDALSQSMGVAHCDIRQGSLHIEYDLRQITWAQIERRAMATGIQFSGILTSLRRALWRFTERNELKNLAHWSDASCCNHPPSGTK